METKTTKALNIPILFNLQKISWTMY